MDGECWGNGFTLGRRLCLEILNYGNTAQFFFERIWSIGKKTLIEVEGFFRRLGWLWDQLWWNMTTPKYKSNCGIFWRLAGWKGDAVGSDQRLANPRQNNLQTLCSLFEQGQLLKMLVFCTFSADGEGAERVVRE